MNHPLKHLLLVTLEDPTDPLSWSGIPFSLRCSLEKHVQRLTVVGGLRPKRTPSNMMLRVLLGGKPPEYPLWMSNAALKGFARAVEEVVERDQPQAILSISSQCIVFLNLVTRLPVALFSDAPWLAWKQAYKDSESMPLRGHAFAKMEAAAAAQCDALFFASDWAASEAKRLYGITGERLYVTPFGANWVPNMNNEELLSRIDTRDRQVLRLLFVGKDWERKGGPLAVEITRELNQSHPTELHIVGCLPEVTQEDRPLLRFHGLLSRNRVDQEHKMRQLFLDSHFLVVPTNAECFGIVFAESFAHGLPAVSQRVHAVPSIIEDGVSGILEEQATTAQLYAARILAVFRNCGRYQAMALAGRRKFETSLTWDSCAGSIVKALNHKMQGHPSCQTDFSTGGPLPPFHSI